MCFFVFYGIVAINMIAFIMYGLDKFKAKRGKWRISETALFVIAMVGGSVGALMAMSLFHHKTQKNSFKYAIPVIMIVHVALALCLLAKWFVRI